MQPNSRASFPLMVFSILLTGLCWGIYGPILHWGQAEMGGRWRTFICVGIAYLIVAVVVPVIFMFLTHDEMGEGFKINTPGVVWSLVGGALGAVVRLGIILAFKYSAFAANTPLIVMPLVFGLAPVANTFFQLYMNRDKGLTPPNPIFYAGLILVTAGAVTVLLFAPKADPKKVHGKVVKQIDKDEVAEVATMTSTANSAANSKLQEELDRAQEDEAKPPEESTEPTKS